MNSIEYKIVPSGTLEEWLFLRNHLVENCETVHKQMIDNLARVKRSLFDTENIEYSRLILEPDCFLVVKSSQIAEPCVFSPEVYKYTQVANRREKSVYSYRAANGLRLFKINSFQGYYGDKTDVWKAYTGVSVPVFNEPDVHKQVLSVWHEHSKQPKVHYIMSLSEILDNYYVEVVSDNGRNFAEILEKQSRCSIAKLELTHILEVTVQSIANEILNVSGKYINFVNINNVDVQIEV